MGSFKSGEEESFESVDEDKNLKYSQPVSFTWVHCHFQADSLAKSKEIDMDETSFISSTASTSLMRLPSKHHNFWDIEVEISYCSAI
jgi:hypothetical protein